MMPKMDAIPSEEAEAIERYIKSQVALAGSTLRKVAEKMNEKYTERTETPPNITRQLKGGTMPAWKERRIADVLGYEVVWKKKE